MDYNEEDFNWTDEPIIGAALVIMSGVIDSTGGKIDPLIFYKVGKRKKDGKVILERTDKRFKFEKK